jgi:signal transduction histidine kinase
VGPDYRSATRGATTSSILSRSGSADGLGRLAAALASSDDDVETRLEARLSLLTIASRAVTIVAGVVFGALSEPTLHFWVASLVLVVFASLASLVQLRAESLDKLGALTIVELVVTVAIIIATGGFHSPFVLTPITSLLMAGYVWGRRATIGTTVAGAIAILAAVAIQSVNAGDEKAAAGQIAIVYLLCGALGAFTRNLVAEIELQRAAAIDQATQMATANDLLVSLHALAQTLPASFDLGEVVESIRQRVRALFPYTALVVLVPDDAGDGWRAELAEGVRVPARLSERDMPAAIRLAMTSPHPVAISDRMTDHHSGEGFAPLCRSGLYTTLRARGALVGAVAIEHLPPDVYGADEQDLLESLSSVLALSLDNARWFGRLHTLGAEAERGRIARELHDRIAQSLAYVTFELERVQHIPGDKREELANLHDVVRDIMQELRETIYQLRANVSEQNEFIAVAGAYLARYEERTGIATEWAPSAVRRLPYRVEQELWRIAQEALANVERHSGATRVRVVWDVNEHSARLEVSDNGKGFVPGRVAGDHYGIVGMRERADAIGARLQVVSRGGRGTSVVVEVETAASRSPARRPA